MLAQVAHDQRLSLFRISLAAELVSEVDADREVLRIGIDAIREGVASLSRLVQDLDDYTSLQAGHLRLVVAPVNPCAIVKSALAAFALLAGSRRIALSARVEDGLPDIVADRDRLIQVLSNLLANTLYITPPGGSVVVSVATDGGQTRFAVSDTGPGIPPDDVAHLFERSWRGAHGSYAGQGLGLAIARELVECHGGEIWAENQQPHGACISFTVRGG